MKLRALAVGRYRELRQSRHLDLVRYFALMLRRAVPAWPRQLSDSELANWERVLVLAPHPDDESFGMGGTLLRLRQCGKDLRFVWFTNGDSTVRRSEAAAVLEQLAPSQTLEEGFPVLGPSVHVGEAARIVRQALDTYHPTVVCIPSVVDPHYDHVRVGAALDEALRHSSWDGTVLQYEVWTSLVPNVLCDISPVVQEKERLMRTFASQLGEPNRRYVERMLALNCYRGLPHQLEYAEGFVMASRLQFMELAKAIETLALPKRR